MRALIERVGNEADEDSQPTHMRRITAFLTECEKLSISEDIAEAQQSHVEKLTKVEDAIIKVAQRINVTTKPLMDQWVDTMYVNGARKARWTARGYEQTTNGNEDFFSETSSMIHLKKMLVDAALEEHVAAIRCSNWRIQWGHLPVSPESRQNGEQSLDRASRGRIGTKLHL